MAKEKIYKELYVLVFKETGEILTPDSFTKYWKNYGSVGHSLSGWRAPKKIYYTLGTAKTGFNYIPDQLKDQIEITIFTKSSVVVDGANLKVSQKEVREKREKGDKIRQEKWKMEEAEESFKRAEANLKKLKNE